MLKLLTSLLALSLSVSFLPAVQVASFWTNTNTPGISGVTNDTASVNLGLKFSSDVSGTVTGVRFYKGTGNTGTHIGSLWSSSGSLLASVTFANETASGWQQANFASPISITANTVYTISYLAPRASYAQDQNYAWSRLSTAPLHVSGSLPGVFTYSARTALPVSTWNASNYYVDVVFTPNVTAPNTISGHVSGTTATLALSGTSTASTTTDDAGNYTFVGLTSGSYSVTPKQQGYTFSPSATTVPVSTANVTGVNFAGTAASTTALSVTTYGAKGDGVTDDTAAIQKALSAAAGKTLNFPKPSNRYLVGPLNIPSNSNITLAPGTVVQARSGFTDNQVLVSLQNVSNVSIVGPGAVFQMPKAEYTSGEHRHCLAVRASTNVHIEGIACNGSGGDGFYIATASQNVTLLNVSADNNRRQGLSIISGTDVFITNSVFSNTNGTDPQCGIDIEPNSPSDRLRNIVLSGVQTSGNVGCGLSYSLFALDNTSLPVSITVDNYHDTNSKGRGIQGQCNWTTGTGGVAGTIVATNSVVDNPASIGVYLKDWEKSCAPITFVDLQVNNPNGTGINLVARSTLKNEQIGNMHFVRPTVAGTSPRLSNYVVITDSSHLGYSDITFTQPTYFTGASHPFAYPSLLQ